MNRQLLISILLVAGLAQLTSCAWYEGQVAKQRSHKERNKVVTSPDGSAVMIKTKRPDTQEQAATTASSPKRSASMNVVQGGLAQLQQGALAAALQSFQEAATLDGSNGVAYYYMARTHYALGNHNQAGGILDRAESLLDNSDDWQLRIAAFREELSMSNTI